MANLLMRPGSILLIIVIGTVLIAMFGWAKTSLENSKENSFKEKDQAIECSTINVDFVDQKIEGKNHTVFLQVNKPAEALMVQFKGSRNVTRIIENVETNSIVRASARIESVSEVQARVKGCERVFG